MGKAAEKIRFVWKRPVRPIAGKVGDKKTGDYSHRSQVIFAALWLNQWKLMWSSSLWESASLGCRFKRERNPPGLNASAPARLLNHLAASGSKAPATAHGQTDRSKSRDIRSFAYANITFALKSQQDYNFHRSVRPVANWPLYTASTSALADEKWRTLS